jgi:hypothetical protein
MSLAPATKRRSVVNLLRHLATGVLVAAADKCFLGPAVAPASPNVPRDGFCPIGPWVVGRSHVADPDARHGVQNSCRSTHIA